MFRKRHQKISALFSITIHCKYLIMGIAISVILTGCSLLPVEENTLVPPLIQPTEEELEFIEVARGDIQTYLKGTANFVFSKMETFSFQESGGRLKAISVSAGDEVKAGDLLVELETGDLELQIELQKLNVERASIHFKQAKKENASAVDLRLREIDLEREKKLLESMEKRLANSQLRASISGIVTFVESLNVGDFVNPYETIVSIADPSNLQLTYVAANTAELSSIEVGMPVDLKYRGKEYKGRVLQSPSNVPLSSDNAKQERNAVTIIVGMEETPDDVQFGHSAELTIKLQSRENVIVLPRSAIRSYMGRSYVQIMEENSRKEVDIEVGLVTPTEVEVIQGLKEGQKVILSK